MLSRDARARHAALTVTVAGDGCVGDRGEVRHAKHRVDGPEHRPLDAPAVRGFHFGQPELGLGQVVQRTPHGQVPPQQFLRSPELG